MSPLDAALFPPMTTPFDADYGTSQGRIEPTDGPPFEGSFVIQLGHDLPGVIRVFKNGDSHTVSQTAAPLVDLGFEAAGASPGLAAGWTATVVATGQALLDFGASSSLPPNPTETFEWFTYKWFFVPGDTTVPGVGGGGFNTGLFASPVETFEVQWPGLAGFLFYLATKRAVTFTGALQAGIEDFESGWGADAASFLFSLGTLTSSGVTFAEGIGQETFGDTLVASVVVSSGLFTVSSCPDDGTPISFRFPSPGGITWSPAAPSPPSPIYYVVKQSSTTFKVSTSLGGSPVTLSGPNVSAVLDVVGARTALPASDVVAFTIGAPSGSPTHESFESVRGSFSFTVDTSTDIFYAANHTFVNGDEIVFTGPGLPAGSSPPITEGVAYYVINYSAGVSFQVSATLSGAALTGLGAAGAGATVAGNPAIFWNSTAP